MADLVRHRTPSERGVGRGGEALQSLTMRSPIPRHKLPSAIRRGGLKLKFKESESPWHYGISRFYKESFMSFPEKVWVGKQAIGGMGEEKPEAAAPWFSSLDYSPEIPVP